jgi:uncharacterized membrane protein
MNLAFRAIPDRIFVGLAITVMALTWGMMIWIYPDLPAKIPSHFGPSGQPDAHVDRTVWTVILPGLLQVALTGLFWWIYRHPQYSNIPSTVMITMMPEPYRGQLYRILRHLTVVMMLCVNIVFAHISLTTISVSLGLSDGLNPWLMGGTMIALFGFLGLTTVRLYRVAKHGAMALRAQPPTAAV